MEISTEINKEKNIRQHTIKGRIDVSKLIDFLKGIHTAPDFDLEMKVLCDLREADFASVASSDFKLISDNVGSKWGKDGKNKAALVATRDLDYGLSRMYQIMLGGVTPSSVTVFKDMDKAKAWIEAD